MTGVLEHAIPTASEIPESQKSLNRPFTVIENIKGQRVPLTPPAYVDDEAINLPANAIKVLEKRYLRRDLDGTLLETPAGMFYRLAYHIAQVEEQHAGDAEAMTKVFYDLLTERRFYPNSPTFTGAGTPLGQLAACFVLPIEDDMGKAGDGIFSTLRVAALIQQTGGGNGFSFSRLRPKNDVVHTSSGRATGPVGFLRVYDQAFGEIAQGGSREGAPIWVCCASITPISKISSSARPKKARLPTSTSRWRLPMNLCNASKMIPISRCATRATAACGGLCGRVICSTRLSSMPIAMANQGYSLSMRPIGAIRYRTSMTLEATNP